MRFQSSSMGGVSFGPGPMTPGVKMLLYANVGTFVVMQLTPNFAWYQWFGLVPNAVVNRFQIWQFVTYLFLHGGLFHIFINMFVLWMFGVTLERRWGTDAFLQYFLIVGVGAGIVTWLADMGSGTPTIGASGAIYGLLLAFGMTFPDRPILFMLLFPIPAKYAVMIFGAIEFFAAQSGSGDNVNHITHLAGLAIGFLYLKTNWQPSKVWRRLQHRARTRHLKVVRPAAPPPPRPLADDDDDENEVNAILDKINREGLPSLTEDDKAKLREHGAKLEERRDR